MLAAIYDRPGSSDVLSVEEVDAPEPGPGEVRVRVSISGVNPTDWKARAGVSAAGSEGGVQIPGQDGSGVIDAVGRGVDPARVGERVWVYFAAWRRRWGTAAQWTVLPGSQAVRLPDGASDELGAGLGIPALTAHRCLFADGPIDGRTVLVAGGAGAVGHAAIELARWAGARVVTTVSSEAKAHLARVAGAHAVVRYDEVDAGDQARAAAPEGVDRVVEVALRANLELDLNACATHAIIASYADDGLGDAAVPVARLMRPNLVLRFVLVYTMPVDAVARAVADITRALEDGALTSLPVHRLPLARIADAHDAVENGAVGKVLVDVP